jgi:hypothetical protein
VAQIKHRFPRLAAIPDDMGAAEVEALLKQCGYRIERDGHGVLRLPDRLSSSAVSPHQPTIEPTPLESVEARLAAAMRTGGFLAVKALHGTAVDAVRELASRDGVTTVDVTAVYIAALREAREKMAAQRGGKPTWETVLQADRDDAPARAKAGLAELSAAAWSEIGETVRAASGVVLLHDAAPLARMEGGMDLLRSLIADARRRTTLHGLWLLCPMSRPARDAELDGVGVGALRVDHEQIDLPPGFGAATPVR